MLRRSLQTRQRVFGASDPTVAFTSLLLALVLTARQQYEESRLLYNQSLKAEEQNFGLRSPEVATVLEEFAKFLHKIKSDEEARALESRAKSIRAETEYVVRPSTSRRP